VNARRKRKMVIRLKDECGIWIENQQTIVDKFITNFANIFKSAHEFNQNIPTLGLHKLISYSKNNDLVRLTILEDIRQATCHIDSNITLGLDDFHACFFKHYWTLTKQDLFNSILEFFKHGKILKELNHMFIMLIPKTINPSQTNQFRPSLYLTIYKIISKILFNRLRPR